MDRYSINDVIWRYDNGRNPRKGFIPGCHVFAGNNYEELLRDANEGKEAPYVFTKIREDQKGLKGFGVIPKEDAIEISKEEFENNFHISLKDDVKQVPGVSFENVVVKSFLIVEKERERTPFNLSKESDRNILRGKWIREKSGKEERMIINFYKKGSIWKMGELSAKDLFENWEFIEKINGSSTIGKFPDR